MTSAEPPADRNRPSMQRLTLRARLACAALVVAALIATVPSAAPALSHLRGIAEIRDWFNAGKGRVRLILLLSPT